MTGFQHVLVVDNGERAADGALSAQLAGLGYASVTAPFETTEEVLALMPNLLAVVLQVPPRAGWTERRRFEELAGRLRKHLSRDRVPVILTGGVNGATTLLQNELGARALAAPDR